VGLGTGVSALSYMSHIQVCLFNLNAKEKPRTRTDIAAHRLRSISDDILFYYIYALIVRVHEIRKPESLNVKKQFMLQFAAFIEAPPS
jgi:hypothetical protein